MRKRFLYGLAAVASLLATTSEAAPITGLFNTGVDDSGTLLAIGAPEIHYSVAGSSLANEAISPNPAWITDAAANWIGPVNGTSNAPVGEYNYSLAFDLTGFDVSTVSITGAWASDNSSEVLLNGQSTGLLVDVDPFQGLTAFSIDTGFQAGENTLTFRVTNDSGPSPNPTGLLVTNLEGVGDPVPEPASIAVLCIVGGVLLGRHSSIKQATIRNT